MADLDSPAISLNTGVTMTSSDQRHVPTEEEYIAMLSTPQFNELRSTFRNFAFPLSVAFLVWFFVYIVTATYYPGFASIKLYGAINVGLVMGLLQFVTTALVTWAYVKVADNKIDPLSARVREEMEYPAQKTTLTPESI